MDQLLVQILTELNEVTYLPLAATAVIYLTQLTKLAYQRFAPTAVIDYGRVAIIWQIVMWLLYLVAEQRGQQLRFENIAQAIEVFLPIVLALFGSTVVGQGFYKRAKAQGTPGTRASSMKQVNKPASIAPPE